MELEFIWIKKFKNINNLPLNFSKRCDFICEYKNETFFLKITNKKISMPTTFFGDNISNINAIAGQNGSGKSSILTYLHGDLPYSDPHLYIFFDIQTSKLNYISNFNIEIENQTSYEVTELYDKHRTGSTPKTRKSIHLQYAKQSIYHLKCNFDYSPLFKDTNIVDRTQEFIDYVEFDNEMKLLKEYSYKLANSYVISLIINLVQNININDLFNFNIPNEVFLTIEDHYAIFKTSISLEHDSEYSYDPFLLSMLKKYEQQESVTHNKKTLLLLVEKYLLEYVIAMSRLKNKKESYDHYDSSYIKNFNLFDEIINYFSDTIIPLRDEVIRNARKKGISLSGFSTESIINSTKQAKFILATIATIADDNICYYGKPNRYHITLSLKEHRNTLDTITHFLFLGNNSLQYFSSRFASIDWHGMSEGELVFLKTLGKIYQYQNKLKLNNRDIHDILILVDEPDLSLHPELARKFINTIVSFTNYIFNKTKMNVHYIITTHSPFILSDLPKDSCILLKKSKLGEPEIVDTYNNMSILVQITPPIRC